MTSPFRRGLFHGLCLALVFWAVVVIAIALL